MELFSRSFKRILSMEGRKGVYGSVRVPNVLSRGRSFVLFHRFKELRRGVVERFMNSHCSNAQVVQTPRRFFRSCRVYHFASNFCNSFGEVRLVVRGPNSSAKFGRRAKVAYRASLLFPIKAYRRSRISSYCPRVQAFLGGLFRFEGLYNSIN